MSHEIGQMFYHGEVPWHGLGRELPKPATLEEAMAAGGLNWEVEYVPLATAESYPSPVSQRVAIVRTDRHLGDPGRVLGVVHPDFEPLQNRDGMELFHRLLDIGDRRYYTGGYLRNGEVVWLLAKLPDEIVIGSRDRLETYLLYSNSHDGSQAIDIRLTTIRVVCRNTLSLALNAANGLKPFRRRHRGSPLVVERDAKAFFELLRQRIAETQTLFVRLAERACDDIAFKIFLRQLLPDPALSMTVASGSPAAKAHETLVARLAASRDEIVMVRQDGIPDADVPPEPPTWWGALNAITAWVDHRQACHGDRYAHALLGSGDRLKSKALELVPR